jgi:hypothetical protein
VQTVLEKQLQGLEGYICPLWARNIHEGSFDESSYQIDYIVDNSLTQNDDISNLQALCQYCHALKIQRFNNKQHDDTFKKKAIQSKILYTSDDEPLSLDDSRCDSDTDNSALDTNEYEPDMNEEEIII